MSCGPCIGAGRRAPELPADDQTPECLPYADTLGQTPGLASGHREKPSDQPGLCWAGTVQLSPAGCAPLSQDEEAHLCSLKTGRSYRPATEWVWSDAPAIISPELFEKAQVQLQRNAELARKTYQPASRRYLLRRLVKCGECGLAMTCTRQLSACKKYEYLYYECRGHAPLTCGRVQKCPSRRVRADRLDTIVWDALSQLLQTPAVIPHLHHTWAHAKQHHAALAAQQTQLLQRQQRLARQSQRLLDAYQAEIISLERIAKSTTETHGRAATDRAGTAAVSPYPAADDALATSH